MKALRNGVLIFLTSFAIVAGVMAFVALAPNPAH